MGRIETSGFADAGLQATSALWWTSSSARKVYSKLAEELQSEPAVPAELNHILLVEDDPDIQTVAAMVLRTVGGLEVSVCASGREAVDHCRQASPDMVLLDVMMPGMDGPATLRAMRELPNMRDVPVVFMTARAQPDEVARYRDMGIADVIVKPFDPGSLCDQVRTVWAETTRGGAS